MSENLILVGFALLFVAIILIIVGVSSGKTEAKFGFGGFFGPIPFGFANDPRMLWLVILISAVLLLLFILPWIKQIL